MFKGRKFVVKRESVPKKRADILERIIKKHGGVICEDVNESDVIVAASPMKAKRDNVVSPEYISRCVEEKALLPMQPFLLLMPQTTEAIVEKSAEKTDSEAEEGQHKSSYVCLKSCVLNGPNEDVVKQLSVIKNHRYVTGNPRSELSYSKAISGLRALPHRIRAGERVPGIGPKISAYVRAFLETGEMPEVRELEESEEYEALNLFCQVYGVGPKHAREFYMRGWRRPEDISAVELTPLQQIGAKYYRDFMESMTRQECEGVMQVVREFASDCKVEAMGGFRRGKELSNDLDLFITHPRKEPRDLCRELISKLTSAGCIAHILVQTTSSPLNKKRHHHSTYEEDDLEKCFVVWNGRDRMHRVDFIFPAQELYAYAVLGWTGSRQFERSLRLFSSRERGWKLTSTGVFSARTGQRINVEGYLGRPVREESDIFEALGIPYKAPEERNC